MIDPLVRPAVPEDASALEFLEREARSAVVGQRGGDRWLVEHPEVGEGWPARMDDADVLIGHIDEVPIAYIVVLLGDDRVLRVDQVWVSPEARELGFGDELLAQATERGVAAGALAVEGQALPGDRHTKNLYERAGIVARLITTFRWL